MRKKKKGIDESFTVEKAIDQIDSMYEVLMEKWTLTDIDNMDISHFLSLINRREKEKEKNRKAEMEAFFNSI